jgi:predicted dehydrogenase
MDRRAFLVTTGVALAQTPAATPTAVIGVGNRGSYLLDSVLAQPNAKVVALCDNKPDRLDKAATKAAGHSPKTTTDWRRIIENRDVEAVYIATPPHLHAEMAVAALGAGKHVYCEKPIGVTPAQVAAVVAAARSAKRVFVAGQQLRSHAQLSEAVGKIHDGIIGEILAIKAQRHATADLPYDSSSGDWYYDVTKSGGYLIEQSVHNLDVCNWVLGQRPVRANGFGAIRLHKNEPPGRSIFDCGTMSFEYPGGAQVSFTQNVFHPRGMPHGGQNVLVYGSKGAVDLMYACMLYPLGGGEPVEIAAKRQEPAHAHTVAFFEAIQTGGAVPADVRVGAEAALTAILGHEAMVKGNTVTWNSLGVNL